MKSMKTFTSVITVLLLLLVSHAAQAQTRYVNAPGGVNLRSGPGTNHPVVTTIAHGAQVRVISSDGAWTQVEHNGRRGYVSSQYLTQERPSAASDRSKI
jgi:uncharacterized protein YraI